MDMFNIISGTCSVLGLLVSLFTAGKVIKVTQKLNCNERDDHSSTVTKTTNSTIHGVQVGRDLNHGAGNRRQLYPVVGGVR